MPARSRAAPRPHSGRPQALDPSSAHVEDRDVHIPIVANRHVVKDLDGTAAGQPYHAGNRALKEAGYVADVSAHLHDRFVAAGLVTIGRTNTPEFGLQPTTESEVYGAAHNPWDLGRTPGGSSGGSAAALSAPGLVTWITGASGQSVPARLGSGRGASTST